MRYLGFTDHLGQSQQRKDGKLWIVGRPDKALIEELGLMSSQNSISGLVNYYTHLSKLAERGWILRFVTPCAVNLGSGRIYTGPIENAYIFEKQE